MLSTQIFITEIIKTHTCTPEVLKFTALIFLSWSSYCWYSSRDNLNTRASAKAACRAGTSRVHFARWGRVERALACTAWRSTIPDNKKNTGPNLKDREYDESLSFISVFKHHKLSNLCYTRQRQNQKTGFKLWMRRRNSNYFQSPIRWRYQTDVYPLYKR